MHIKSLIVNISDTNSLIKVGGNTKSSNKSCRIKESQVDENILSNSKMMRMKLRLPWNAKHVMHYHIMNN